MSTTTAADPAAPQALTLAPDVVIKQWTESFKNLYNSPILSDLMLVVGDEKIFTHKIILFAWCSSFQTILGDKTDKEFVVTQTGEELDAFKTMLRAIYLGNVSVTTKEASVLLAVASSYGCAPVVEACGAMLGKMISGETLDMMLNLADKYSCANLQRVCGQYIAQHFDKVTDVLAQVSVETLIEILKSDDITAKEETVYETVIQYAVRIKEPSKRDEALNKLLPFIRFNMLPGQYLEMVEKNPLLKNVSLQSMLFEAYKALSIKGYQPKVLYTTSPRKGQAKFVWQFMDDHGWKAYDKASNDKLEAAYTAFTNASGPAKIVLQIGRNKYNVDLKRMVQANASTGNERKLRRQQESLKASASRTVYDEGGDEEEADSSDSDVPDDDDS